MIINTSQSFLLHLNINLYVSKFTNDIHHHMNFSIFKVYLCILKHLNSLSLTLEIINLPILLHKTSASSIECVVKTIALLSLHY